VRRVAEEAAVERVDAARAADITTPREFFDRTEAAFEAAAARAGRARRRFEVAGRTIELAFAGPALSERLGAALAHLETADDGRAPDLSVSIWDAASTGVRAPPPPWRKEDHLANGEIRGWQDERVKAFFQTEAQTLSLFDVPARRGLFWARDARALPFYEEAAPLKTIVHWWARLHGLQLAHGAAVGGAGGAALLVGKSGSGKSTAALACLEAGLLYASDDYALLDEGGGDPAVLGLYASAKIHARDVDRFPGLAALVANRERLAAAEKAVLLLGERHRAQIARRLPVRAVLLPRVTGRRETRALACSPGRALLALAPSTMLQLPGPCQESLDLMARVVRRVPCFVLEVGTDLRAIPAAIERILSEG
jgi:hypothetical protein